jgi:branched-chain amino acid transport system permease protein
MSYFVDHFWELTVLGVTLGSVYALIAIGYTLVYGVLQLINFAHSEVFMSGAFAGTFAVIAMVGAHSPTPSGWSSVWYTGLALGAAAACGGVIAFLLERVAYRPLRRRGSPKLVYLITAIGASLFLLNLAGKLFGRNKLPLPETFTVGEVFKVFGAPVTNLEILIVGSAFAVMFGLDRVVNRTKLGSGIRAVAQDTETAQLMGVDIDKVIAWTFIVGGLLGGFAGLLFGIFNSVSYTMGFVPGIKAFAAAVLGGIGNIRGAMLGGILLGLVESYSQAFLSSDWLDVVAFVVLVGVLMIRPTGLLGERVGRTA